MMTCKITTVYNPIVYSGDMPETNPQTAVHQDTVVFTEGANVLTVRSPNMDNTFSFNEGKILREKIFRDSTWFRTVNHVLNLTALCDPDPALVLAFLKISAGKQMTYKDYQNQTWTGIILNPGEAITYNDVDQASILIQFEADPI